MATETRTRGRGRLITLVVLAAAVVGITILRQRRLAAHRAEFNARYG